MVRLSQSQKVRSNELVLALLCHGYVGQNSDTQTHNSWMMLNCLSRISIHVLGPLPAMAAMAAMDRSCRQMLVILATLLLRPYVTEEVLQFFGG